MQVMNLTLKHQRLLITVRWQRHLTDQPALKQTRSHTHIHINIPQNNTSVICLTRASRGYASPKMPCQLMPGRKKPSEVKIAAMLITMVLLGPWGIVMKSEPRSPCQSPWVYLTDTDLPLGLYVRELRGRLYRLQFRTSADLFWYSSPVVNSATTG